MTRIRVNPGSLQQSAGEVESIASNIRKTGDEVWRSAGSAPGYDGQFGPRVRAIARAALARAQKHDARMNTLSGSLSGRAAAFQAADQAGVMGLRANPFAMVFGDPFYLRLLAGLTRLSIAQINRLLRLGQLGFPRMPWNSSPVYASTIGSESDRQSVLRFGFIGVVWGWISGTLLNKIFGKNEPNVSVSEGNISNSGVTDEGNIGEDNSENDNNLVSPVGIAEKVPVDDKQNSTYYRGDGKTKSNCVWYAAEAVKVCSGGKVLPAGWGNASEWIDNAKNDPAVSEVNKTPSAGSVIVWNYNHVGFVESVEIKNGKAIITWSEENYGGEQPYWGNKKVEIETGDLNVKRWRITTEYPVNDKGEITDPKIEGFIHF